MRNIKPILFSTSMVQAILEGRKTQTRRVIKLPVIEKEIYAGGAYIEDKKKDRTDVESEDLPSPFKKGDLLWVRETFEIVPIETAPVDSGESNVKKEFRYKADSEGSFKKWRPSIFMPKAACRIFLQLEDVRVERLLDISEADAIAEGVLKHSDYGSTGYILYTEPDAAHTDIDAVWSFESLWESINGRESWDANPWVWVYEFKRVEKPENFGS